MGLVLYSLFFTVIAFFLMDFMLSMIFVYLLTVFEYLIIWCLHCVFRWFYSDLLYIVTTLGHYCLSLSFSGHSHLVLRVFLHYTYFETKPLLIMSLGLCSFLSSIT